MRHAYLILAHNEFPILEALLDTLDDPRNAIFVHIDKKVVDFPVLQTFHASLHVLNNRLDVRWGDVSVVEAELLLLSEANQFGYFDFYHLLSGVDLPLKSQDEINQFFEKNKGKQFIGYSKDHECTQLSRKVQRYHLFPGYFRSTKSFANHLRRGIRFLALRLQMVFGVKRNRNIAFKKGTQWVSLTQEFVEHLLGEEEAILACYRYTFCADEIFVQTVCWNSPFRNSIYDVESEGKGSQRAIRWKNNQISDWGNGDYEELMGTACIFARKFNVDNMDLVKQVVKHVANKR